MMMMMMMMMMMRNAAKQLEYWSRGVWRSLAESHLKSIFAGEGEDSVEVGLVTWQVETAQLFEFTLKKCEQSLNGALLAHPEKRSRHLVSRRYHTYIEYRYQIPHEPTCFWKFLEPKKSCTTVGRRTPQVLQSCAGSSTAPVGTQHR